MDTDHPRFLCSGLLRQRQCPYFFSNWGKMLWEEVSWVIFSRRYGDGLLSKLCDV